MLNVCPACGIYSAEKEIDPSGPFAVCAACGHRQRFLQLPLFVISGASGAGKTAVGRELIASLPDCVVLESDVLWRPEFAKPEDDYREYRELWLRLAKNIGQSGRPVVLCGSALPEQFECCRERRYFAGIWYLALVCDDAILRDRLQSRPSWRGSGTPEFMERMCAFNHWLNEHAAETSPAMAVLDTGHRSLEETVHLVASWVRQGLQAVAL